MPSAMYQRVRSNPKFQELVARRSRFAWLLSAIVLVAYYGFMMVVAFQPQLLHTPLAEGSVVTVGVPVGAAIIIVSWLLTGLYIRRANSEFDQITTDILGEAKQ